MRKNVNSMLQNIVVQVSMLSRTNNKLPITTRAKLWSILTFSKGDYRLYNTHIR